MEQSAHLLTLSTADLGAARRFYADALGWSPALDVPGEIIFFQIAPGLLLGLFDAAKFSADLGEPGAAGQPAETALSGMTLAHNVDSPAAVEAIAAAMARAGATVLKHPQDGKFGGVFHALVRDPNGLMWEIAHNPHWRIGPDGVVSLG